MKSTLFEKCLILLQVIFHIFTLNILKLWRCLTTQEYQWNRVVNTECKHAEKWNFFTKLNSS